jgi:hypothetical protein
MNEMLGGGIFGVQFQVADEGVEHHFWPII